VKIIQEKESYPMPHAWLPYAGPLTRGNVANSDADDLYDLQFRIDLHMEGI
jgi:hypothetical protein